MKRLNMQHPDPQPELRAAWRAWFARREQLDAAGVSRDMMVELLAPLAHPDFAALTCGAWSRQAGRPCRVKAIYGNGRCRFHGGLSTGPRGRSPDHSRRDIGVD